MSARFGLADSGREAGAHKGQALGSESPPHSAYVTAPSYPHCTLLCTLSPGAASSNSSRLCFQGEWWYKCRLCQLSDLASLLPQTSLGQQPGKCENPLGSRATSSISPAVMSSLVLPCNFWAWPSPPAISNDSCPQFLLSQQPRM